MHKREICKDNPIAAYAAKSQATNGFKDKLLAKQFSSNCKKEEAYRWRLADM
jgi:hypothetical protein